MFQDLLIESAIAGVMLVAIGIALHYITIELFKQPHDMNDIKVFAVHLLVAGFIFHLISEWTGINKWYCKNGVACRVPQEEQVNTPSAVLVRGPGAAGLPRGPISGPGPMKPMMPPGMMPPGMKQ